jgi:hypothetical protein
LAFLYPYRTHFVIYRLGGRIEHGLMWNARQAATPAPLWSVLGAAHGRLSARLPRRGLRHGERFLRTLAYDAPEPLLTPGRWWNAGAQPKRLFQESTKHHAAE